MEGNRRLIVQRPIRRRDDFGAVETVWADHATLWARVEQPRGREHHAPPLVEGRVATVFRTRYGPDVRATDRIRWDGADYDVHAVLDEHGAHRWLLIHATAAATEGNA